ncbi:MAG: alpha/beta hydrolase [Chloroflexota bacterium]
MPTIKANDITLAYEQRGNGPHLVLIAGVGYGGWFWHKIGPGLARHFTVTTFDNRGAGGSDKPAGPYTVDALAADTAGLLDALAIQGAAILGHSLGGYVAQRLIATRPDLVGRLILASTNFGGTKVVPISPEALNVLMNRQGDPLTLIRRGVEVAAAAGFAEAQPEVVQELIEYRLGNPVPPAQYTAQVMAGAATLQWTEAQVAAHLAAIQVPTLILFGEQDKVVPVENAYLLAGRIAQSQVKILPNTGHIFPIEDPAATIAAITGFLLKVEG